jgi:hypothetical protein
MADLEIGSKGNTTLFNELRIEVSKRFLLRKLNTVVWTT